MTLSRETARPPTVAHALVAQADIKGVAIAKHETSSFSPWCSKRTLVDNLNRHLGVFCERQKARNPPKDAGVGILDGPRDTQSVDVPNELEDSLSLEISAPEGFQVIN
eukprot:9483014-Pyramimonas_sp.AAC.1